MIELYYDDRGCILEVTHNYFEIRYHRIGDEDRLHRTDGPAFENICGDREWCFDGLLHRDSGPAVILADGTEEWWRWGQQVTQDAEWCAPKNIKTNNNINLRDK